MDFAFTEEHDAVRDLAARIIGDYSTPDRLRELEAGDAAIDGALWDQLADAGLLGVALPESIGGSGRGFMNVAIVATEIGRRTALVPYVGHTVGSMAMARFGLDLNAREVGRAANGAGLVALAIEETRTPESSPGVTADADGRLTGTKTHVAGGTVAETLVVSATAPDGQPGLYVTSATAGGTVVLRQDTFMGAPEAIIELSGSPALELAAGSDAVRWVTERATAGLSAVATGVCEEALRLTAEYTKSREQFDRVIASFQAVGQRAADAYIDTQAVRLSALHAAWRLDAGLPAAAEVAAAKFWVAEGGQRVVHAAQHLHGGMGVDRDYPLHRYFLWAKQLELGFGGATSQLLELGRVLAEEPA